MKITAYILLVGLIVMGMNRFVHGIEPPANATEMSCEMDCCGADDDCEKEEESSADQSCPEGCDCGCCFHITAIHYQFLSIPAAEFQSYHFVNYFNNYQFEFFIPLFQPPRMA